MIVEFIQQEFLLFIALLVITFMLVYSYVGDRFLGYKQVSPEEATRLYNRDAVLIDVRSEAEYKTGFIGEALNISLGDFKSKINSLEKHKNKDIVLYCQSGARSGGAAANLAKAGFEKVYNLRGGILAWKSAGLPVNQPATRKQKRKKKGK